MTSWGKNKLYIRQRFYAGDQFEYIKEKDLGSGKPWSVYVKGDFIAINNNFKV